LSRAYPVTVVEARWRTAWDRAGAYRATPRPGRRKFFNYASGPFPSGPLHLGHVRTYVLGDVTARRERLRGKAVLHGTEWDAFGLPNELAAAEAGLSPEEHTRRCIARMEAQLRALGIGYDWSRVHATCDPAYYRWTQRLFLDLLEAGEVERAEIATAWCPRCATGLARMQAPAGLCWRCGTPIETRPWPQWFVRLDPRARRLADTLPALRGWSGRIQRLLRPFALHDDRGSRAQRWLVSRQRAWGTPIPVLHCAACGPVPVPHGDLPVLLPAHGGRELPPPLCPRCSGPARRDPDTLDCFFDDLWCFLGCAAGLDRSPFDPASAAPWMPVDHFHSGLDTFAYLPLHRWLGDFLQAGEPIVRHEGHDLVLCEGRKMSKHLGNAQDPQPLLDGSGADALRVAVLWAAGPQRPMEWRPAGLARAEAFLDAVYRLFQHAPAAAASGGTTPSTAAAATREAVQAAVRRVGELLEDYRPHAALEQMSACLGRLEAPLRRRHGRELPPGDAEVLREALRDYARALAPFAPHLAEELWHGLGEPPFVFQRPLDAWR
jgi:leucyl-tRNA synthetase